MKSKYVLMMLIVFTISLFGRENPFKSVETSATTGKAIYKKDTRKIFSDAKIKLPSSARILKSVELHFQNLDGSMGHTNVRIDKKIDWHDELILKKVKDVNQSIVMQTQEKTKIEPKKIEKQKTKINFKNIVSFLIVGKELHIKTKDKKIRDFLVTKPYKIVIDFKRELSFYTKVYNLKINNFKSITIGKHSGYYRIVVALDGKYLYDLQKEKDGYKFTLK
ncbi:AMIN domain-containing protein [Sulfurospirillum arcachonense]|uniref:AMIN domain-containing protein n=1 Tax=Sulfurospirillum arcachonense TaxID=57666 RepID=UPI000468202A|nr:AMIN domain-containing protein [Sulfurospirillum arcachonense]